MEEKRLKKIKRKDLLNGIFNYISDKEMKLKLFKYSKYFQKKFGIKKNDYKEKYLELIEFDINNYLHRKQKKYSKDYLNNEYNNFLLEKKLNKEEFEKIIFDVLENKKTKDINEDMNENIMKEDSEILLDIESPLLEIISKGTNFENNYYTIYISQKNIDEYNLKNDYITFFNKLNKSNINYSSIYYKFGDKKKINYLKELNIDFNKIKKIYLIQDKKIKQITSFDKDKIFFEALFSFNNIENNLIYLKIKFNSTKKLEINIFENINNFKSLNFYI